MAIKMNFLTVLGASKLSYTFRFFFNFKVYSNKDISVDFVKDSNDISMHFLEDLGAF